MEGLKVAVLIEVKSLSWQAVILINSTLNICRNSAIQQTDPARRLLTVVDFDVD